MRPSEWLRQPVSVLTSARSVLDKTFSEEPVSLTVFVQDKKYLNNPRLSDIQYDAIRHVEQIYYPTLYPIMVEEFGSYWEPVRFINFATLQWGKGSGKDHTCRLISLRVAYLLLCLRSPQEYYEMPAQDTIHMLNVASSSGQAQQAFFIPMTRAVRRGWFQDRCEPKMNVITFEKNVEAVSGHSDAESQEGLNLKVGIADEIDAFRSKDELIIRRASQQREPTKSAEGILTMMRTSAATRFPDTFKTVRISYPRYLGSTIQKLTADARRDNQLQGQESRHYVSGPLATWEVNPRVKGPEVFEEDYKEDPVMARAKYECKPAGAVQPFFRNDEALAAHFAAVEREPVTVAYDCKECVNDEGKKFWRWDVTYDFDPLFVPIEGANYAMHADIAISRDRCGVAMSHVRDWNSITRVITDEEGGESETVEYEPLVVNDFTFYLDHDITATPAPREIQIRWVQQLVHELRRRAFAVGSVTFDSYQSTESIQRLKDVGIEADRLSTDKDPSIFVNARDMVYSQRLSTPYVPLLHKELSTLQAPPSGKIDHPPGGSKDLADAWACSIYAATLLGGAEEEGQPQAWPEEEEVSLVGWYDMPDFGLESFVEYGALP